MGGVARERSTRYSDVCGTIDELKRMAWEEGDLLDRADPFLADLLGDVTFMLDKMEARAREYEHFRSALHAILSELDGLGEPERSLSRPVEAEALRELQGGGSAETRAARAEKLCLELEEIRDVANRMERLLRSYRTLASRAAVAYRGVRGGRNWAVDEEGAARALPIPAAQEAWLPPSPHREIVLDWIARGRLHLLIQPSGAPLIEFEDGGTMPLHEVRWSEEVENFHRKDERPNARAYMTYRR